MIVLGTIAIKNMEATTDGMDSSCFAIIDKESDFWELCMPDGSSPEEWVCAIE